MKQKADKVIGQRIKDRDTLSALDSLLGYKMVMILKKTGKSLTKEEAHTIAKILNYSVRTIKYTNKTLKLNTLF